MGRLTQGPGKRATHVTVLAPMRSELEAVIRTFRLRRTEDHSERTHQGTVGRWIVNAMTTGIGPERAREATRRVLEETVPPDRAPDHVMVVGIAGGLDPTLGIGALIVPDRVTMHPDGPVYVSHPLPPRQAAGALVTTDGLLHGDGWRPLLEAGFGALDMESAAVAEVCEGAGVPWSVYRGISDRPEEQLVDLGVLALSQPDGSIDRAAVAAYIVRHPGRVGRLARLNRGLRAATAIAAAAAWTDLLSS